MLSEEQIVAKLKQPTPQYTPPTVADEPVTDSAFQTNMDLGDPLISMRLYDFFDLTKAEKYSEETQHKLKTVLEWASAKAQSNDIYEVMTIMQRKELEIGFNPIANRLNTLYRLAKIEAQANFLELERRAIYGG